MAKSKPLPPLEQVRERMELDPDGPSGLRWTVRSGPREAGQHVGSVSQRGYWVTNMRGRIVYVHRLAWMLHHGRDPHPHQIDHIDGDPLNNDPANLRLTTDALNRRNGKAHRDAASRHVGVSPAPGGCPWRARICAGGETQELGRFRCETAAALAYHQAAIKMHGEFARTSFTHPADLTP